MGSFTLAAIIVLGLVAGVLIGCIGIGGVVLVPALHYLGGIPIHTAIGAAMMAYLVSGAIGTIVFGNKQSI
ncbi:MAG: TSUP family transporter, partial [Hyphomicrobium sp.]